IRVANQAGSTAFIWDYVTQDRAGTKQYAIGTENHMVDNLRQECLSLGIKVVNLAEAPKNPNEKPVGCGCATMSRHDPPHLVALLDLLRQGKTPEYNEVKPGDMVNELTGKRQRLSEEARNTLIGHARVALENMIRITDDGSMD